MEHKIGEIFEYNGEWYQCIEGNNCKECDFRNNNTSGFLCHIVNVCLSHNRADKKQVIFKKLEKVGESYEHCGKLYQCYKLPMEIRLLPNKCNPIGKDNLVKIEIKQNKEDMEERKLDPHMEKVIDEAAQKLGDEISKQLKENLNKQLIGRDLTWQDEPVELKEE